MNEKSDRLAVRDKKIKKLFKKGSRVGTEREFNELLKRAIKPQK